MCAWSGVRCWRPRPQGSGFWVTRRRRLGYWAAMHRIPFLAMAALSLLAACGSREPLKAPPGAPLPVVPEGAPVPPTSEELLTPPAIARPERQDDSLRRSEKREDDRFDLPPAG